ncbi:MAG: TolC family outer membrane protein [Rhizobiaceae bacterium]|nr:TolC family outer membrane protein [Rhizobiaceae bacterium]
MNSFRMKIGKYRLSLGTAVAIVGMVGLSSIARAETINGALASAYNNNPTLNAQRAATRVADESIAIAKSGYRPTITANANIGLTQTTAVGLGLPGTATNLVPRGFGVVINQALWDSYLTRNNVESARAAVRASQESLRNAEQNILFNGASAYLDVLRDRSLLSFQRKNLEFLQEQVRSEQARFEVGEATRTDVAQARASRAAAQAQVSLAAANLKSSEAIYQQIIGKKPGKLSSVKGVTSLVPKSVNAGISIAYAEHPAIKTTEHIVDQALFNVKAAESGLLPRVDLQANANRSFDTGAQTDRVDTTSITATLTVPIYQAGQQSATVRQSKEQLGQNRIQVDEAVDNVRAAVVSAFSQYQGARAAIEANRAQLNAAQLALEGAVEERKVGQRTTLDVLDTQTQVINAQIALTNSTRDVKVAGYAILSAIGRLNPKTLNLRVTYYDPNDHKNAVEDKWFGLRIPSGN